MGFNFYWPIRVPIYCPKVKPISSFYALDQEEWLIRITLDLMQPQSGSFFLWIEKTSNGQRSRKTDQQVVSYLKWVKLFKSVEILFFFFHSLEYPSDMVNSSCWIFFFSLLFSLYSFIHQSAMLPDDVCPAGVQVQDFGVINYVSHPSVILIKSVHGIMSHWTL